MASQPDKWDYTLAGVPSPLTDELESQQLAKQVICCSIPLCNVACISLSARALAAAPICVICSHSWSLAAAPGCATCSQLGHLLQHLLSLLAIILVTCCSISLCSLRSNSPLQYLQVAIAYPAPHAIVLLALNCINCLNLCVIWPCPTTSANLC